MLPELGRVVTVPVATWRLEETVWPACQEYFVRDQEEERLRDLWRREAVRDLGRMFEVSSDLGAVELTRGSADALCASDLDHDDHAVPPDAVERLRAALAEPDLPLARLTPLGLRGVRDRLLAEGRDAPLVGELAGAPPAELLGVLAQHHPPQDAVAELQGWPAWPGQDVEMSLRAVRDCPFRTRVGTILASGHPDVGGLRELRELVAEPLRKTARHPLRLVLIRPPGARGRRKKRKH
ncbi:hypothetical protein ACWEPC_18300 [Nonomuraea sp. NPDC004297]